MIKPSRGYVLIEPIEDEGKTASGVYVPDNAKDKPSKGTVLSLGLPPFIPGTDQLDAAYNFHEGNKIYYRKWAGEEIRDEIGKELKIVKFDDVIAVINE